MVLPRFVKLQSYYNHKYLQYTRQEGVVHRFLQFKGEAGASAFTIYKLEKSTKKGKEGLVHIKCCYNNCYWVRGPGDYWIRAGAEKPEEDESNPNCTLFEPIADDGTTTSDAKTYRFRHVHSGNNACLWRAAEPHYAGLYAGYSDHDRDRCDVITIIDCEPDLATLPKHVAFKGKDGYLSLRNWNGCEYLSCVANTNSGDPKVRHQVFTDSDNGYIRIKSECNGKFWRAQGSWIVVDSDDSTTSSEPLFWPIKVGNNVNVCVLRSLHSYNSTFCCASSDGWIGVYAENMDAATRFEVEDLGVEEKEKLLPRHVAFKGKDGYLSSRNPGQEKMLWVANTNSKDPSVRHEVFTNSDGSIRIKSEYNGKFWRAQGPWIFLDSDGSTTTTTSPETLFRLMKVGNNLYALQSLLRNSMSYCGLSSDGWLILTTELIDEATRFEVEDLAVVEEKVAPGHAVEDDHVAEEKEKVLPRHVAFKGKDGYLTAEKRDGDAYNFLYFVPGTKSGHQIFTNSDGSIRIKSDQTGNFWRISLNGWIMVDSDGSTTCSNSESTLFRPIKVDNNLYVLRSLYNNNVCNKRADLRGQDGVAADTQTIDAFSYLEMEELV